MVAYIYLFVDILFYFILQDIFIHSFYFFRLS